MYRLDDLAGTVAHISTGENRLRPMSYHSERRTHRSFGERADQFFIEAVFGDALTERAAQKYHLTARQQEAWLALPPSNPGAASFLADLPRPRIRTQGRVRASVSRLIDRMTLFEKPNRFCMAVS